MKELGLKNLFQYECGDTTRNRYVSGMDWNEVNTDLLAVSYGEFDHDSEMKDTKRDGLLLFWTLKNPKFPERTIKTKSSFYTNIILSYRDHCMPIFKKKSELNCYWRL